MIVQFLIIFKDYLIELLPYLAIGFFLSGIINEFVPTSWVERHLGGKGLKPLLYSTLVGAVLPICCIGSLPVAISLRQKGARLGPVLAFLVATPATSISALLVAYGMLGLKFTVYIFFAVIVMGLIIGVIGNLFHTKPKAASEEDRYATCPTCGGKVEKETALKAEYDGVTVYFCCSHCQAAYEEERKDAAPKTARQKMLHRLQHVFRYAFLDMPRNIGLELLLGLVLAALVASITPIGDFIGDYFDGGYAYPFSLIFGLMMYICSTASVPLVHAFISQGMNIGAGMVLLMVGPVTSWSTILVLRKQFGGKILAVYLGVISTVSLTLGYVFSII